MHIKFHFRTVLIQIFTFCSLLFILFQACTKDKAKPIDTDPGNGNDTVFTHCDSLEFNGKITYTSTIKRIFDLNCATADCHDAITAENNIRLDTYDKVKDEILNGKVLCSIKWEGCVEMPNEEDQLSVETIDTIDCWIERNLPEN